MSLLTPNTNSISSFEEKGRFLMAWRLCILFFLVFTALAFVFREILLETAIVYAAVDAIALGIMYFLYKTKKSRFAFWIYTVAGSIIAQFTLNTILDSAHFGDLLWIISTILFAFVGLGRVPGMIFTALHAIGLGYYVAFNLNPHFFEVRIHNTGDKLALYLEILLAFTTIAYLLNQYVVFQQYAKKQLQELNTSLEEQNQEVLLKNKENITLVKEVHHRVKNNLQIIISLLRMQRSEIESEEAQKQFSVAINRILTMSMIHQKLYQEKEPSKINIRDYLQDLTAELVSLSEERISVRVNLEANNEFADLKTIVPLGLLINELVANSMKHAYQGASEGAINMQLSSDAQKGCLLLNYWDDGKWLEPKKENGFGLELIDILTEQMEGTFTREGSRYSFEIPLEQ
ncbi:MAG: sensor histidine kinase [bacterium]|nr:sensor histidine kinase [bacterium]